MISNHPLCLNHHTSKISGGLHWLLYVEWALLKGIVPASVAFDMAPLCAVVDLACQFFHRRYTFLLFQIFVKVVFSYFQFSVSWLLGCTILARV